MNTSPPAVTIGPPRFGLPHAAAAAGASGAKVPSGTSHFLAPVARSMATRLPNGGGVHGAPEGPSSSSRRITDGVPRMSVYWEPWSRYRSEEHTSELQSRFG